MKTLHRFNLLAVTTFLVILCLLSSSTFNVNIGKADVAAASNSSVVTSELWNFTGTNHTRYQSSPYWSVKAIGERIYAVDKENYQIPGEDNPFFYSRTISTLYVFANNGTKLWNFTRTFLDYVDGPKVIDGTVYIAATGLPFGGLKEVYALDAETGAVKWAFNSEGNIKWYYCDSAAEGIMYVGDAHSPYGSTYNIYAVNTTSGQQVWKLTFPWGDDGPQNFIFNNGVILFGHPHFPGPEGDIGVDEYYALNATDGSTIWKIYPEGSPYGPSALISGLVCFSTRDGVCAINSTNGKVVWKTLPEQGYYFSPDLGYSGNIVYAVEYQDYEKPLEAYKGYPKVYGLSASNGTSLWQYLATGHYISHISGYNLDTYGDKLYLRIDETLFALDIFSGKQLWNHSYNAICRFGSEIVYFNEGNNTEALNATGGASLWNYTSTKRFVGAQDSVLYFQTANTLSAMSIEATSITETNNSLPVDEIVLPTAIVAIIFLLALTVVLFRKKVSHKRKLSRLS